jgi:hypothetical protein
MNSDFKSIAEAINSSPELSHIKKLIDERSVEQDFFEIFPEFKQLVKSVKFSKDTLKISVENPALRNELKFHEAEVIKRINDFYKSEKVKRIQFSNK